MPAAAPVPRGPSLLTLYDAADLLTAPGCPVCRYAGEASDRYLGWFALEAHADAVTVTRLAGSLGMCAPHTRRLMAQPGAARRLTAVYRYIVVAARDRLAGRAATLAACPGCDHDEAAAKRALDTLLDGLADGPVKDRCRELGGLCIPHLAAATARGRQSASWLAETMAATLLAHRPGLEWLAGAAVHDAEMRAVLWRAIPATARPGSYVCAACLAGVRAESDRLARLADHNDDGGPMDPGLVLCGTHLGDAAVRAGRGRNLMLLLAWQANCHAARLSRPPALARRMIAGDLAGWVRAVRRRPDSTGGCAICRARDGAEQRALDDFRQALRASPPAGGQRAPLCVRHLLGLRAADPWAGQMTAGGAVGEADALIAELTEAFRKNTWEHRREPRGPEATAWRRAVAFLDGRVFCGAPPRQG